MSGVEHTLGKPGGPGLFHVKGLGLPDPIEATAKALIRSGKAKSTGSAIAIAVAASKRFCAESKNPEIKSKHCAAVAEWEKDKLRAHAQSAATDAKHATHVSSKGFGG